VPATSPTAVSFSKAVSMKSAMPAKDSKHS